MKVFNRRNVLKGGLVGSMAAGFASFVGASHAAEPAAKAPAQNDKNTYDVIVLGAGPAGLVTAIAAKQAGAKKVVVFEKRDRPDGNAIFALGSVCGWGSRHQKEQGIKDTADDFYAMMMDVSKQMGDKALNRTYTDNISAGIDWLEKDIGVKFGKIRPMPYPRLVPVVLTAKVSQAVHSSLRNFLRLPLKKVLKLSSSTKVLNFFMTTRCVLPA